MVWWPGAGRGLPGVLHCSNSSVLILQAQPASPSAVQATPVSSASTVAPHTLNHPTFPAAAQAAARNKTTNTGKAIRLKLTFLSQNPPDLSSPPDWIYWRGDYAIHLYANESQHWKYYSNLKSIFSSSAAAINPVSRRFPLWSDWSKLINVILDLTLLVWFIALFNLHYEQVQTNCVKRDGNIVPLLLLFR